MLFHLSNDKKIKIIGFDKCISYNFFYKVNSKKSLIVYSVLLVQFRFLKMVATMLSNA
jgi:hypothetical protein